MKKQSKQMLSLIIAVLFLMLSLAFSSFAEEDVSVQDSMLRLAEQSIFVTSEMVDNSYETTYKVIDCFIEQMRCAYPDVSDLELAVFILQFTHQSVENLPDKIILRALEAKEIVTQTEYIQVDSSGGQTILSLQELQCALTEELYSETITPQDTWTSSNGYMKIETVCTFTKKVGEKRYYTVSAKADWLKMPICFFEDVLAIAHTGKFNDEVKEFGYKYQNNICCGTVLKYNDSTNFPHGKLSLDYPSTTGTALRFKLQKPINCNRSVLAHFKAAQSISAYLTYGIIVEQAGILNVRSAYCHKEVAVGSIGVSCTSGGISFSLAGLKHDYNARIITVNVA